MSLAHIRVCPKDDVISAESVMATDVETRTHAAESELGLLK